MEELPDSEIRRAMLDLGRICRSLLGRTRAIAELSDGGNPMGPMAQWAGSVSQHLESALKSIAMMGGGRLELDVPKGNPSAPSERVVVRCVSTLLRGVESGSATREDGSGRPMRKALQGYSWAIAVPQVVEFLGSMEKTGTLQVSALAESFTIVFDRGQVIHAESDQSPAGSRLGDILVTQGALTRESLASFLRRESTSDLVLGEGLVRAKRIDIAQLEHALEHQIRGLFQRLFAADDATFSFYEVTGPLSEHCVRLVTPRLLLESAAALDQGPGAGRAA